MYLLSKLLESEAFVQMAGYIVSFSCCKKDLLDPKCLQPVHSVNHQFLTYSPPLEFLYDLNLSDVRELFKLGGEKKASALDASKGSQHIPRPAPL